MSNDGRKLIPVKNNAGIYKIHRFDSDTGKWKDTGKLLATRRRDIGGVSKREKAVFSALADARDFRLGSIEKKVSGGSSIKRIQCDKTLLLFSDLVEEWKAFHFLTLRNGTRILYERKLPYLDTLNGTPVKSIDCERIDKLVKYWTEHSVKSKGRLSFEKELSLLTVILNFYHTRKDRSYVVPIDKSHYEAATVVKRAKREVRAMSEEDLGRFLAGLKNQKNPVYYPLALTQFSLALRIGEACGLRWCDFDFEKHEVHVRQTVCWNDRTWNATIEDGTKNGKTRKLALPEMLKSELLRFRPRSAAQDALLFSKEGAPLNRKSVGVAYNRVIEELGIEDASGTHIMRATAATQANDLTGDFFAVQQLLDHSSPQVTQRYVKKLPRQKRRVAEALNGVLERTLQPQMREENLNVTSLQKEREKRAGPLWSPEPPEGSVDRHLRLLDSTR